MTIESKIIVFFNTTNIHVYSLLNNKTYLLDTRSIELNTVLDNATILDKISTFLNTLTRYTDRVDNTHIRLYATGIFQNYSQTDKDNLINSIFIDYGLYFNIIQNDLENFYLEQSRLTCNTCDILKGLIQQEFRNVVVCGSYQNHLTEIESVIKKLKEHNVSILSPRSTKIKQETIGTPFVLFDYQDCVKNDRDTWRHKFEHMQKFKQADAIIVCNPGGTVGKGTIFEFGFMVACSKRIIFTEQPNNISVFFPYEIGLNF